MMHTLHQWCDSRYPVHILPGSVGVACSPMLSMSCEGMGCEPVFLTATGEAVSIRYFFWQNYTVNLFRVVVCELCYWPARCFSRAFIRGPSYLLSMGSLTWLTYTFMCVLGSSTLPMLYPYLLLGSGNSTHVCMITNLWNLILSLRGMIVSLPIGSGPSKLW